MIDNDRVERILREIPHRSDRGDWIRLHLPASVLPVVVAGLRLAENLHAARYSDDPPPFGDAADAVLTAVEKWAGADIAPVAEEGRRDELLEHAAMMLFGDSGSRERGGADYLAGILAEIAGLTPPGTAELPRRPYDPR